MGYIVIPEHKILIKVSPKANCTNVYLLVAELMGISVDTNRNKLLGIHATMYRIQRASERKNTRTPPRILNFTRLRPGDYSDYTKLLIMREPINRLVLGLIYLNTYGERRTKKCTPYEFVLENWKNGHLAPQINFIDTELEWDHIFDVSQWSEFVAQMEALTGKKLTIAPASQYWNQYDKETDFQKITNVQKIKNEKLSQDPNQYFSKGELENIRERLKLDIIFYEETIQKNLA